MAQSYLVIYYTDPDKPSPWAILPYPKVDKSDRNRVFESYAENILCYVCIVENDKKEEALKEGKRVINATFC